MAEAIAARLHQPSWIQLDREFRRPRDGWLVGSRGTGAGEGVISPPMDGIALLDLLKAAGFGRLPTLSRLQAAEGYFHVNGPGKLDEILLATHVGGQPLEHRHGYPLRAVVPSRRGWSWVKWLASVEALA